LALEGGGPTRQLDGHTSGHRDRAAPSEGSGYACGHRFIRLTGKAVDRAVAGAEIFNRHLAAMEGERKVRTADRVDGPFWQTGLEAKASAGLASSDREPAAIVEQGTKLLGTVEEEDELDGW